MTDREAPAVDAVLRFLEVVENDVLPKTEVAMKQGNRLFGGAIVRKSDLSLVVADTNMAAENPVWHGEVHALKRFFELPVDTRPNLKECWFIATHEPCSLCLSAITWAGLDNFSYLFSYEDSTYDAYGMPLDLKILQDVFHVQDGAYANPNPFWTSYYIQDLVKSLPEDKRAAAQEQIERIKARYDKACATEQVKSATIPL